MYVGSGLYVWQTIKLRVPLMLSGPVVFWSLFNASWPLALWSVSLACLLDETPRWLLESLRTVEHVLPTAIYSSLFVDPPALYPVCRLLQSLIGLETTRLQTVRAHAERASQGNSSPQATILRAAGGWESRGPLSDKEVATIISRRLARFKVIHEKLERLARSDRAVPTAITAPILEVLNCEVELLEKVLEIDTAKGDRASWLWRVRSYLSSEQTRMYDELEASRTLLRRIGAVKKLGSVGYSSTRLTRHGSRKE